MEAMMRQFLSLVLLFGWVVNARSDERKEESPFQKMAREVAQDGGMIGVAYGIVPGISTWEKFKGEDIPRLRHFPKALLKALDSPGTEDHEAAGEFVQSYAALSRGIAFRKGRVDLEVVAQRTFAPNSKAIEVQLAKALDSPKARVRLNAATALLAFQQDHKKAKIILARGIEDKDPEFRAKNCLMLGVMHLTSQESLNSLTRGLVDEEAEVREATAN